MSWEKQVEDVFNGLARQAAAQAYKQISGKGSVVQQRADQVLALAARGDKSGLDRLIRSWPVAEARQVQAEIERR
ncbi:hypothetical protein ACWGHI_12590 [Streptomyces sp. NPDC054912]|uniref:hypothetical protein n=1 Tax=Streptomyces sp. NPDC017949 TaxID=3365020 RepID=UPI00379C3253